MKEPIYILIFERYGNREGHHYIGGLYSDLAVATIEGLEHEMYRANKYELRLEIAFIDSNEPNKEVPREVALNMAKLKFPEKFDDRGNLKETLDN